MRGPPRLILEIDVSELLFVSVAHDVVVRLQLGRPGRREAAFGVSHYCLFLAAAAGGAGRISAHGSDFFLHPDAP